MGKPAIDVLTIGIMVGPMDHPTTLIPFIHAEETDPVTLFKIVNARCQIDIVCHQQSLAAGHIFMKMSAERILFYLTLPKNFRKHSYSNTLGNLLKLYNVEK